MGHFRRGSEPGEVDRDGRALRLLRPPPGLDASTRRRRSERRRRWAVLQLEAGVLERLLGDIPRLVDDVGHRHRRRPLEVSSVTVSSGLTGAVLLRLGRDDEPLLDGVAVTPPCRLPVSRPTPSRAVLASATDLPATLGTGPDRDDQGDRCPRRTFRRRRGRRWSGRRPRSPCSLGIFGSNCSLMVADDGVGCRSTAFFTASRG